MKYFPISNSYAAVNYCLLVGNAEMKKGIFIRFKENGMKMVKAPSILTSEL